MRAQFLGFIAAFTLLLGNLPAQSHGHCGGGYHRGWCPSMCGGGFGGFGFSSFSPYYPMPYYPISVGPSFTVMPSFGSTASSSVFYQPTHHRSQSSSMLIRVQSQLKKLGYYKSTVDGHFGPATRKAIATFQGEHGLPVTGRLDTKTLQHLRN